jgi:hypothetical protein
LKINWKTRSKMPSTFFRHADHNTNCPPISLATFKTTVTCRKQPQHYRCLAAGSRGQCDSYHLKWRQYYIACCIRVPPWFECMLLVRLSPHCLIRRPSCPDSWSYHTGLVFPWTVPILLCSF